jgi:hypothetical protein
MIKRYVSRLQDKSDALHCMMLSTGTLNFLVPSVAIAEICNQLPITDQNLCHWRDLTIPFFSIEKLLNQSERDIPFKHIAVLHRLNESASPSFWAIGLTALPKVMRVEYGDLNLEKEHVIPNCIAVRINQEITCIPDLKEIENCIPETV